MCCNNVIIFGVSVMLRQHAALCIASRGKNNNRDFYYRPRPPNKQNDGHRHPANEERHLEAIHKFLFLQRFRLYPAGATWHGQGHITC